jgi:hypothetical protein
MSSIPYINFTHVLNTAINTTSVSTDLNVGGALVLEGSVSLDGDVITSWDDLTTSIPTNPEFSTVTTQNLVLSGEIIHPLPGYFTSSSSGLGYWTFHVTSPLNYINKFIFVKGSMSSAFKLVTGGNYSAYYDVPPGLDLGYSQFRFALGDADGEYLNINFYGGTQPVETSVWMSKFENTFIPLMVVFEETAAGDGELPLNPTFSSVTINGFTIAGLGQDSLQILKGEFPVLTINWAQGNVQPDFYFYGNIHAPNFPPQ